MTTRALLAPSLFKVLVIAAGWTVVLTFAYTDTYFMIHDLVGMGKLSGSYPYLPDLAGNVIVGLVGA